MTSCGRYWLKYASNVYNAFDCGCGQFACALSTRIGWTKFEDVREETITQVRFDFYRNRVGGDFVEPRQEGTSADGDKDEKEGVRDLR